MAQRRGCFGAAQSIRRRFRSPCRGYSGLRSQSGGGFAARGAAGQWADWRSAGDIRGCAVLAGDVSGLIAQQRRGYSGLRSQSGGGFAALAGDGWGCAAHWPGMFRGCAVNPAAVSQPLPGIFGAAQPTGRGYSGLRSQSGGGFAARAGAAARADSSHPAAVDTAQHVRRGAVMPRGLIGAAPGMVGAAQPTGRGCFGAAQSIRRRFRSPCRGYSGLRGGFAAYQ